MFLIFLVLPQVVYIGSNQSVSYKTQHGEMYAGNTKCVVHFKVSFFNSENSVFLYFVHRRGVPVHFWWCLAQSLTYTIQKQSARAKAEIFSLLERKGLKPFSLVHLSSVVCFLIYKMPPANVICL